MNGAVESHPDVARLRRAVRSLDDPPRTGAWNAQELANLPVPPPVRAAAVLVPFVRRADTLSLLFTRRTAHLRNHGGQISFPGGGVEAGDRDVVAAALRETDEETGIGPDLVEPFGYLDVLATVSGYHVTPVAGFVDGSYRLRLDEHEVDEAFEVPLAYILEPGHLQREAFLWNGHERDIFAIQWQGHRIWGATAAILKNLLDRLEHTA